ncbi:MAG TPA: hypothetical protein VFH38_07040 [Jatrophihabitans sp.]|nr:hypothetical protein [Jatrophihabitans sp.]
MSGTNPEVVYTGSDQFDIVVHHYGDARGTKDQFAASNPGAIDPLIDENYAAHTFANGTVAERLRAIRTKLAAAWEGENADHAAAVIDTLQSDAETIAANTLACGDSFAQFQRTWANLKSQAESLYEGVMGSGLHEDNTGAHRIYKQFNDAMQQSMHAMPSRLYYHEPLQQAGRYDSLTPAGTPGGGGGSGGSGGPGGAVGGYGGPGYAGGAYGTGSGHVASPGTVGPGSAGGYSAHGGVPAAVGPAGYATGGYGTTAYGPGDTTTPGGSQADGLDPGSSGSPGSEYGAPQGVAPGGAGPVPADLSSTLAGFHPADGAGGPVPAGAYGGGYAEGAPGGAGGIGAFPAALAGSGAQSTRRSGVPTSSSGLTGSGTASAEPGAGAAASGAAAAENGGRGMMVPMRGAGTDDEHERSRAAWLCEDDDIWGGDDAPPGVIA